MRFSYGYTLARRAVVATLDLSARNLHLFQTDHWLSNPKNVVQVWLHAEAWQTGSPVPPPPSRLGVSAWSVEALAAHLACADAEGLAQQLRNNSVTGADFKALTENDYINDLKLTRFAARKLVSLKGMLLAQFGP